MRSAHKILFIVLLGVGLIFARSGKNNPRVEEKKVKNEHYLVKDQSGNSNDNKLDRKRSHKRRRKIRKPVKGLR